MFKRTMINKISRISFITAVICLLSFSTLAFGKTEVLFSPRGKITETIIRSINSAEHTIDIAVFILTSGDIAEALLEAKGRGINIRIVLDVKQGNKQHPILEFLKEEQFNLQYLKGNLGGFMHNSFAIFDKKLIITGSYNWTEYAEKYNYENVIVSDEQNVVNRFNVEFEKLFAKSRKETLRVNQTETMSTGQVTKNVKPEEKELPAKPLNELPDNFLNISFEAFDAIFGTNSQMSNAEKKKLWKEKFKDKYVRWRGTVCYKGVSLYDWNKIGISHKNSEDADVQIQFDWTSKDKVRLLRIGRAITYLGKLDALKGLSITYKLTDCKIVYEK